MKYSFVKLKYLLNVEHSLNERYLLNVECLLDVFIEFEVESGVQIKAYLVNPLWGFGTVRIHN